MSDAAEDVAFSEALERFRKNLTKDQREQFAGCNKKEVQKTIADIQQRHGSQRRQKNMRRVSKFIEGMSQLGQVIEVFLNVDVTVAFIWTASTCVETLDLLLDTYAEIGETLPGLAQIGTLFKDYDEVGKQLKNYYCDVLEFNKSALEVFSRPAWKTVFHSTWKTFQTEFRPILSKFKMHQKLLSEEKLTSLMSEMQRMKCATRDNFQQLRNDMSAIIARDEAKILAETEERRREKRRMLRDELGSPDYQQDQEDSFAVLRESSSGDWIANEPIFKDWSDLSSTQSPLIYLSGIPGAGKTTLVSGIVDHFLELKRTTNLGASQLSVVYFYFKYSCDDKRDLQRMMRSILSQLVDQDPSLLDFIYKEMCSGLSLSSDRLKKLTETAIRSQRLCFLVVDGLDECARHENSNMSEAVRVLEWLKGLNVHSSSVQNNIRILVSAQRDGVIEDMLKEYPTLQLENMKPHEIDIQRYVRSKAQKICQRFSDSHVAVESKIVEKITTASKGMFLYAKVVLDNLIEQMTVLDFEIEMEDKNFPKKLEQAYARVVERVLKNSKEQERQIAEKILGWVVCAYRPLRWREIQSLFCIDSKAGTADTRRRPLKSCKYFCSSLVDITGCKNDSEGNEARIELVHVSAKQYLIHTQSICLASEHAKMALFSSRYLLSKPFQSQAFDEVQGYALSGYYNVHDYFVTSWWHHTNESFKHISSCPENILSEMVISLSRYLRQHFTQYVDEHVIHSTSDQTFAQFRRLPVDQRSREESGSLGERTRSVREALELVWKLVPQHPNTKISTGLQLYGPKHYKCPHSWCHCFEDGFLHRKERDDHINQHMRPFRCPVDGCYATSLGFASQLQLQQHDKRYHPGPEEPRFFVSETPKEYKNVWAAIAEGALEAVTTIIDKEIKSSGFFDFSKRYRRGGDSLAGTTALECAVMFGNFDICQLLLSKGASPFAKGAWPLDLNPKYSSALQIAIEANDADIMSMLISHFQTKDIQNAMGSETKSLLEHACAETQNAFMNALEFYHPQILLPCEWLMNALRLKQRECIKFYFLRRDGTHRNKTILPLPPSKYYYFQETLDYQMTGNTLLRYIIRTSGECFQTLLSYEQEDLALKQIFFEACALGKQIILSRLPPMKPELSEWFGFEENLSYFIDHHEVIESSHPLVRVIERLKPRNVWNIIGTHIRFLPLEPWLRGMNTGALKEMLHADNTLLFKKNDAGATLLHGFVNAKDPEMVKFIASVEGVDLNAATLLPVRTLSTYESASLVMYQPEGVRHQEMLSEGEKEIYERHVRDLWEARNKEHLYSNGHEKVKREIMEFSCRVRENITAKHRMMRAAAVTPIKLALYQHPQNDGDPGTMPWDGREVTQILLSTGRIDISSVGVTDELSLLIAAAATRETDVMRDIIQKGHSKLCPTVTKDEARSLMVCLPHIASDLLVISASGSGAEILKRELSMIKKLEGTGTYPLMDSLIGHEDFLMARKLLMRRSADGSIGSAEREAFIEHAVKNEDVDLLQRLLNERVMNMAIFRIAAKGSATMFKAIPRDAQTIKGATREDGMTLLQVAKLHENKSVLEWLSLQNN
ncbi:hypothetical protein PFICI_12493 [Pestalotiopsis fici W106-1]|uniref:NACHT domain-containing protein n=1 Tax=Pestalotiopsis fici (strain W106-1 / CGMCC3.15140) TaxID=1229662 RepID=W3WP20_PESFW|nr:uncharacterized protein PFICI_12493 [Pestalotiopsis fici W106-1]ETS75549.1 hypothetical protein PFICI_12493 [Pestalotiopsis fici W106-1]